MNNRYIIFGSFIGLFALIFIFGKTKIKTEKTPDAMMQKGDDSTSQEPTYTYEQYIQDYLPKLDATNKAAAQKLEEDLAKNPDDTSKNNLYTDLIRLYTKINAPEMAAYYVFQKANIVNDAKSWDQTGTNFLMLVSDPQSNAQLRPELISKAIISFEKSIEIDSNNIDCKVKLAECLMEGKGDVMSGVTLLRNVTATNPDHIMANLLLGKFGIISGQHEKAITRLEKVISLQPQNIDAYLLLADAYSAKGEKDKLITSLEKAKKLSKDKDFVKHLEEQIKNIKESK